jgi:hypothetical protein
LSSDIFTRAITAENKRDHQNFVNSSCPAVQTGGSRGTALHELDKPMNPKLRGSLNKQVNKVRHDFHFDYSDVTVAADSHNDLLEPLIDAIDKHFAPIFWAPHTKRCCGYCASPVDRRDLYTDQASLRLISPILDGRGLRGSSLMPNVRPPQDG